MKWAGIRNFLIIAAIAGLIFVSEQGFSSAVVSANQIISVIFIAAIIMFAYSYFRQNRLAWLVIKKWMRVVIIICGAGIVFLLFAGFPLLEDRLSAGGVVALIAALALIIVWIVYESRRFR